MIENAHQLFSARLMQVLIYWPSFSRAFDIMS